MDILIVTFNLLKYLYYKSKFNNAPFSIGVVYRSEEYDIVNGHKSFLSKAQNDLYQRIQSQAGCKKTYTILYEGTDCGYRFKWFSELAGSQPVIINIYSNEIHNGDTGFCYSVLDVCLSIHLNRNKWYTEKLRDCKS